MRQYITTPIYYVNDVPHIGHAYTTILADVLHRYYRLFGYETRFQTGTDEHGTKVQQSAVKRGVSAKEQSDDYSQRFAAMWQDLKIDYDIFFRTTDPQHYDTVQRFLQRVYDNGDIYRGSYQGWYNIRSEMFISPEEVDQEEVAAGRIVEMEEEDWFFRLSKYQDWLVEHIKTHPEFIVPASRRNEVLGMLRDPLQDLCISRPRKRLSWGIPLPFDNDFVTYVWFDALINYITGIGWGVDESTFQQWWQCCTHLIGKDILKPHGVYWPIMLKAAGLELPRRILAHGWWTRGGHKESKTVSSALAAQAPVRHISELVADYGADRVRYFLLREMTLGMDQDYDEMIIAQRLNADLTNDLGNLASRTIRIVQRNLGGTVPEPGQLGEAEGEVLQLAAVARERVRPLVEGLKPNLAIDTTMDVVRATNRYINSQEPWKLVKAGDLANAGRACYVSLEVLRLASVLFSPVMPSTMRELRQQLGLTPTMGTYDEETVWGLLQPGAQVPGGDALVPRIDTAKLEKRLEAAVQASTMSQASELGSDSTEENGLVSIDEVSRLQLRTAVVLSAERIAGADKLLKLQIDLGDHQRQIVAGIANYYQPEDLEGRQIVVVANLMPTTIRGVDSQGMLLAAKTKDDLALITIDHDDFAAGATVA